MGTLKENEYVETLEFNAYQIQIQIESNRKCRKRSAERILNFFFIYFQIFIIRFGRIELSTYQNKPLDSMDFRTGPNRNESN